MELCEKKFHGLHTCSLTPAAYPAIQQRQILADLFNTLCMGRAAMQNEMANTGPSRSSSFVWCDPCLYGTIKIIYCSA